MANADNKVGLNLSTPREFTTFVIPVGKSRHPRWNLPTLIVAGLGLSLVLSGCNGNFEPNKFIPKTSTPDTSTARLSRAPYVLPLTPEQRQENLKHIQIISNSLDRALNRDVLNRMNDVRVDKIIGADVSAGSDQEVYDSLTGVMEGVIPNGDIYQFDRVVVRIDDSLLADFFRQRGGFSVATVTQYKTREDRVNLDRRNYEKVFLIPDNLKSLNTSEAAVVADQLVPDYAKGGKWEVYYGAAIGKNGGAPAKGVRLVYKHADNSETTFDLDLEGRFTATTRFP